jgi:hypothetical protein
MDARELRIGNYVEVNGERVMVEGICGPGEEHIQVRNSQNKIVEVKMNVIKPIPLRGELLLRCCEFDEEGNHTIGIDHHRHYLKVEDGYIVLLNKQKEALIHFWDVRSLHQLQNLYHALKNKEMEIVFD